MHCTTISELFTEVSVMIGQENWEYTFFMSHLGNKCQSQTKLPGNCHGFRERIHNT